MIRFIDLFAGIGGMRLGFQQAYLAPKLIKELLKLIN